MSDQLKILQGDCIEQMCTLPDECVQCCVTSPPYWGLRDYGHPGQIGVEKTPGEFVAKLVAVFAEVRRVLKDDGTVWLNLGDSYAGSGKGRNADGSHQPGGKQGTSQGTILGVIKSNRGSSRRGSGNNPCDNGVKAKDLIGIPWRVALALQADGWYLRSDIIWAKPNCMPESVTDRPTRSHEYIFLLTKSPRYYYDADAIKERPSPDLIKQIEDGYNGKAIKDYIGASVQDASATKARIINGHRTRIDKQRGHSRRHAGFNDKWDALTPQEQALCGANKRDVWNVATANCRDSHFATFPPDLIRPCILAGSRPGDTILDPFGGSGTTGQVALEYGRKAILCELNPDYCELIRKRCDITPGFAL